MTRTVETKQTTNRSYRIRSISNETGEIFEIDYRQLRNGKPWGRVFNLTQGENAELIQTFAATTYCPAWSRTIKGFSSLEDCYKAIAQH